MNNSEMDTFIERMEENEDVWGKEDVTRFHGDRTLEKAINDRMNDMRTFRNIISTILNRE